MPSASTKPRRPKAPRATKPGSLAAWLSDQCQRYMRDLSHPANVAAGVTTDEELLAWWPGGADNPRSDLKAWTRCYAHYQALFARKEFLRKPAGTRGPAVDDAAVMAALADDPQVVTLQGGGTLTVYPKSWTTLTRMRAVQAASEWVLARLAWIEENGDAEGIARLPEIVERSLALSRLLVWIATHPGAGMPYDPLRGETPTRPAALDELHPVDLFAVLRAFHAVNYARMEILSAYLDGAKEDGERPRWAEFFVGAVEPTRETLEALIGDRSVVSVLARVAIAADSQRRATERAKTESGQRGGATQTPGLTEVAPGVMAAGGRGARPQGA